MSTTTSKIPKGFKPRGYVCKITYTDFNNWYGAGGGVVRKSETVSILPTKTGNKWQINTSLHGPGDLVISSNKRFNTLQDVRKELDKFVKASPAAAQAELDEREESQRLDALFDKATTKWLREQYENVEWMTVQDVRDTRPAAIIGDGHHVNSVLDEEHSGGYTKSEFESALRHTLSNSLWTERCRWDDDDAGYTVRKVAVRKDSYLYSKERAEANLFSLREHKGGPKLVLRVDRKESWGISTDLVDEFSLTDSVPVIREFTRPRPEREDFDGAGSTR